MCGIVGYIGNKQASKILLAGLNKLEYRGYDSAGLATIENGNISVLKDKGRVENLYNLEKQNNLKGTIGIAHTRWATHGIPSKVNSHPHFDSSNTFAVVHNGIIENYIELRKFLEDNGYKFLSETDTEVIPNLISYFYKLETSVDEFKFLNSVQKACNKLIGSFALEILCNDFPDNMLVVRKDSPLVIGKSSGENFIASDIPAILNYTDEFYLLDNLEYAYLSKDSIKFYNNDLQEIKKDTHKITWNATAADKNGFEDYMLKEINEQPTAIRETIGSKISNNICNFEELNFIKEYLSSLNQIYIIACGTAMHAGLATKSTIEHLCKIPTTVDIASEFRYRGPLVDEKTLCIFISQSGETADTIAALKLCKEHKAKTIAVTNVIGSSITREADYSIYTHAGPEIAVASTKAYTSQITLLTLLAVYFAQILETSNTELLSSILNELLLLPSKIDEVLKCDSIVKEIANKIYKEKDVFYIGRGIDYTTSEEASLKLKEISYIHSEAYAAGELKHGTIALVENGTNVIGIATNSDLLKKTVSNIEETSSRGAISTLVITKSLSSQIDKNKFNNIIIIPDTSNYLTSIVAIIPLQLLAYYIAKAKKLDVDKPRNLAKSVTVE